MTETIWVALIAASGGAIVNPLLGFLTGRRKANAEADKTTAETRGTVAEQWRLWSVHQDKRIEGLEGRVETLETDLKQERTESGGLRDQVEIQSRLLRSVCRWALSLKDELLRVGGRIPPMPVDVEAALTSLDPETQRTAPPRQ